MDIHNAFLNEDFKKTIFMKQPKQFVDKDKPSHVCKLSKVIYGLKQAPWAWYLFYIMST